MSTDTTPHYWTREPGLDQTCIAGDYALAEWTGYYVGPVALQDGRAVRAEYECTYYVHPFPLDADTTDPEWEPDYGWGSIDHFYFRDVETGEAVDSRHEQYLYDESVSYIGWPTLEQASADAKRYASRDTAWCITWLPSVEA